MVETVETEAAPKKRRFRFGLRTLLFGVVVLVAGLSWWVTWPQRSAYRLVSLMDTDIDRAEQMSPASGMWMVLRERDHDAPYLEPHGRTMKDVVLGKQEFTVILPVTGMHVNRVPVELIGTLRFERGKLTGPIELDSRPTRLTATN
jgi:hypothetical protein